VRALPLLFLLGAILLSTRTSAKDLRVLVSGIEVPSGDVVCLLYEKERGFPKDTRSALTAVRFPAAAPILTCTFPNVAPGRYAVGVVHDVNGDGALETDFDGGTGEPWGVTNNVRPPDRAPQFVEAVIYMGSVADYEVQVSIPRQSRGPY
jgi:uncharacterized protein (DUF2141 family)